MSTSAPPTPDTALQKSAERFTRPVLDCFRRGDVPGLLGLLGLDKLDGPTALAVRSLADLAVETRRESVSVLGAHEVFVRRTSSGDLRQVLAPVRLSLADKTLYQIPIRKAHDPDTLQPIPNVNWWYAEQRKKGSRAKPLWKEMEQTSAEVSYQGFLRLNGVAGCAVGQPPSVMVDGVEKTNPYLQRVDKGNGRLGDIVRVVIAVTVVGPTPATGNPVVVNYTLDYDPGKDLQHMLSRVADDNPDDCYLENEDDVVKKPGWTFVPLYGGVGYVVNLRLDKVREVYAEFTNLLQMALKKAQTVARRNAMKSHPALAIHTVEVDTSGRAVVAITGWAGDQSAMDRWTQIVSRLARGQTIEADAVEVTEVYDPEKHRSGGEGDIPGSTQEVDPQVAERNRLVEMIDRGIELLTPAAVAALRYDPQTMSIPELTATLGTINSILDNQ